MRIAFLTHQWPGIRMGGIGAAVRQSAAGLAEAGHEVHIFTFKIPAELRASIPGGVKIHEVDDLAASSSPQLAATINAGGDAIYRLALGWLLCAELVKEHAKKPFDIVEAPEVEALALPLMIQRTIPVVTHLHCCTAIAYRGNEIETGGEEKLVAAMEFAAIHLADAICAPTQAVVDATRSFTKIDREVHIIPHSFKSCPFSLGKEKGGGSILFLGRLERLKGVEVLAHALNQFLPKNPGTTFQFIGPDTNVQGRSMRQKLQATLNCPDRVEFLGELSRPEVEKHLARASFCVLPSLWENFSMACCEAMAAGCPVIVAEGTGSVEVVGEAGLIARRNDPTHLAELMTRLWRDKDRLNQLSVAARERIARLCDPRHIAQQRVSFYQHIIETRNSVEDRLSTLPSHIAASILPALCKLTGALAGITSATTPGRRLMSIMQQVAAQSGSPAQVLLYGAGKHTAKLLCERHIWESLGHRVVGIIDDHPRFETSPRYLDLPVQSVEKFRQTLTGNGQCPVVLSTDTFEEQMWHNARPLRDAGVPVFRLYS